MTRCGSLKKRGCDLMIPDEAKKVLVDWEPILIRIENEAFTGLSFNVPGWKCRKCGAQFGTCGNPPGKCWKCP